MFKETMRPAWIEINLDHLDQNLKNIKQRIGNNCSIIGIVKADAYGHGSVECSKVMIENGLSYLAVATLDEALELRENGIEVPIILLGIVPNIYSDVVIDNDLIPVISDFENAKHFSNEARKKRKTLKIMISVDTGMGRIGFNPTEKDAMIVKKIYSLDNIEIIILTSHLASADMKDLTYSYKQLEKFNCFSQMLKDINVNIPISSLSNSPAMYRLPESYFDAVRPGAMLWGIYPSNVINKEEIPLLPVMEVKANIVFLKKVSSETSISYGSKFITKRDSIIATLPLGYADGLTRMLQGDKIRVLVHGQSAPVLGTICMDQCMIDITDIPDVKIGDEVVIIGKQNNNYIPAQELCDISGLCSGELFYNFSKRMPRFFIKDKKLQKSGNYKKNC